MERKDKNPAGEVLKAEAAVITIAALLLYALIRIFI